VGAVGSSYNFAAPIYQKILAAFSKGDLGGARIEQYRSVRVIELLASFGYMTAAKAVMGFLGIDVGPARLPHANLSPEQRTHLKARLEEMGFFEWIQK
jgi:N-acetylneuraminate lyase